MVNRPLGAFSTAMCLVLLLVVNASASVAAEQRHGPAVDLIKREIAVREIEDGIFLASGVGNVVLVATDAGHVIFDTGLAFQAEAQRNALLAAAPPGPVTHVVLSHSHADHVGGTRLWVDEDTALIAHEAFAGEQAYLEALGPYLHQRNRTLFPWMPAKLVTEGAFAYGGIHATRTVGDGERYAFTLGDERFEVIGTPGAEGSDNLVLWLPERRILLSGDFFGPQFPQFPNIFTMRGEKVRAPAPYLHSLEEVIALQPRMIVPSHFVPTEGEEEVMAGLRDIHAAVSHVHDATIAGMNTGKSVYQLMSEITLPEGIDLSQTHGKISWAVKSIWEYYATWFHFDRTTELYAVPGAAAYPALVRATGTEPFITVARAFMADEQPVHALHILELLPEDTTAEALTLKRDVFQTLLQEAEAGLQNDYEIYWLRAQIEDLEARLAELAMRVSG